MSTLHENSTIRAVAVGRGVRASSEPGLVTGAGQGPRAASPVAWRVAAAVNAVVAAFALTVKFVEAATTADPQFRTVASRVANEACYFTIQSWIALTAVRGAITGVYPYDFVDVHANGYPAVAVTVGALTAAAALLAVAAVALDRYRANNGPR